MPIGSLLPEAEARPLLWSILMIDSTFARLALLLAPLAIGCAFADDSKAADELVWFGTYTRGSDSEGIYVARFNTENGTLSEPTLAAELVNPSFLARHPSKPLLYCVSEIEDLDGKRTGGITALSIDPSTGKLTKINERPSLGAGPCQVSVDPSGQCVVAANYGGGSSVCMAIRDDGGLEPAADGVPGGFVQHEGSSVNLQRQQGPHAHCARISPNGAFVLVPDLGIDLVLVHKLNPEKGTIEPTSAGVVPPGSGPRHLAFTKNGKRVYVINELALTVTGFDFDAEEGTLVPFQTVSTLPDEITDREGFSTAEVVIHPSGRFLYGSNRGHHSIAMFEINQADGQLTLLGVEQIRGKTPRNFNISPDGRWLLAGGQDSDTVTVFAIDAETGRLRFTDQTVSVPKPVCICFDR